MTSYRATAKECGNSRGKTRSGIHVTKGVCATDWRIYPCGTIMHIPETNEVLVAADTGSGIRGNDVDRYVTRWRPGMYKEGRLHANVICNVPKMGKSNAERAKTALYIRKYLIHRFGRQLSSRGGLREAKYHARQIIRQKMNKIQQKKRCVSKHHRNKHHRRR
jgi:3D (Asp-Asp-Asp) domain-containing protein